MSQFETELGDIASQIVEAINAGREADQSLSSEESLRALSDRIVDGLNKHTESTLDFATENIFGAGEGVDLRAFEQQAREQFFRDIAPQIASEFREENLSEAIQEQAGSLTDDPRRRQDIANALRERAGIGRVPLSQREPDPVGTFEAIRRQAGNNLATAVTGAARAVGGGAREAGELASSPLGAQLLNFIAQSNPVSRAADVSGEGPTPLSEENAELAAGFMREAFGRDLQELGEVFDGETVRQIQEGVELESQQLRERLPEAYSETFSPEWFVFEATTNAPSLIVALGAGATLGPAAGAVAGGLIEAGSVASEAQRRAEAEGKTPDEASVDGFEAFLLNLPAAIALEKLPVDTILKKNPLLGEALERVVGKRAGGVAGRTATGAAAEFTQEAAQSVAGEGIVSATTGTEIDPNIVMNAIAEGSVGGLLGGVAGGVSGVAQRSTQQDRPLPPTQPPGEAAQDPAPQGGAGATESDASTAAEPRPAAGSEVSRDADPIQSVRDKVERASREGVTDQNREAVTVTPQEARAFEQRFGPDAVDTIAQEVPVTRTSPETTAAAAETGPQDAPQSAAATSPESEPVAGQEAVRGDPTASETIPPQTGDEVASVESRRTDEIPPEQENVASATDPAPEPSPVQPGARVQIRGQSQDFVVEEVSDDGETVFLREPQSGNLVAAGFPVQDIENLETTELSDFNQLVERALQNPGELGRGLANPARGARPRAIVEALDQVRKEAGEPRRKPRGIVKNLVEQEFETPGEFDRARERLRKFRSGEPNPIDDIELENVRFRRIVRQASDDAASDPANFQKFKDHHIFRKNQTAYRRSLSRALSDGGSPSPISRDQFVRNANGEMTQKERVEATMDYLWTMVYQAVEAPYRQRLNRIESKIRDAERSGKSAESFERQRDRVLEKMQERFQQMARDMHALGFDPRSVFKEGRVERVLDDKNLNKALHAVHYTTGTPIDMGAEMWRAGLLSHQLTQAANLLGNTLFGATELFVKTPIEAFANLFIKNPDLPTFGEFPHLVRGLAAGAPRAWNAMLMTWADETPIFEDSLDKARIEAGKEPLFGRQEKFQGAQGSGNIPGRAGRIVRGGYVAPAFGAAGRALGQKLAGKRGGDIGEVLGVAVGGGGSLRGLMAVDQLFATTYANMIVGMEAHREAKRRGLSGESLQEFVANEIKYPASESWFRAAQRELELTFRDKKSAAARWLDKSQSADMEEDALGAALKIGSIVHIPFIGTPERLLYRGFQKTTAVSHAGLFGGLLKDATAMTRDGVISIVSRGKQSPTYKVNAPKRVSQAADTIIASGILMLIWSLTGDDDEDGSPPIITGSASGQASRRATQYRNGGPMGIWNPITQSYWSYSRIDPFATILAATVDGVENVKVAMRSDDVTAFDTFKSTVDDLKNQVHDKYYLQGISDLLRLFSRNADGTEQFVKFGVDFTASWVPNVIRGNARATDEYVRETRIWGDSDSEFLSRSFRRLRYNALPIEAWAPPPKVNLWGEDIVKGNPDDFTTSIPFQMLSPFRTTPLGRNPDAVRLDLVINNWNAQNPKDQQHFYVPRTYFMHNGERVIMTDEEYHRYNAEAGQLAVERLSNYRFDTENPTERDIETIRRVITESRRQVKFDILRERGPQ